MAVNGNSCFSRALQQHFGNGMVDSERMLYSSTLAESQDLRVVEYVSYGNILFLYGPQPTLAPIGTVSRSLRKMPSKEIVLTMVRDEEALLAQIVRCVSVAIPKRSVSENDPIAPLAQCSFSLRIER